MGKCKDPKHLMVDFCFERTPEIEELYAKGHTVIFIDTGHLDLIISPKAQMTPLGRLAYVVKKLKDITKEVKG